MNTLGINLPASRVRTRRQIYAASAFYKWISLHQFRHRCIVLTHIEAYRRRCRAYWLFCAARSFFFMKARERLWRNRVEVYTFRVPWVSKLRNHVVSFGRSSLAACIMIHYTTTRPPYMRERSANHYCIIITLARYSREIFAMFFSGERVAFNKILRRRDKELKKQITVLYACKKKCFIEVLWIFRECLLIPNWAKNVISLACISCK